MLALWSAPRSRSTAFARMMAERGDRQVVHEPFSLVVDFGQSKVGDLVANDEQEVIAHLCTLAAESPVFFKDTTDFHYPQVLADADFLSQATHTFIIRHPAEAIASHKKLNPELGRDEIGFARLYEIFDAARTASGVTPVVIDSDDLIERPQETVRAYCDGVGIAFMPEALAWEPGVREEWRTTLRWHEATSRTCGFASATRDAATSGPAAAASFADDSVLTGYLDYHLPYYELLRAAALRP